jgi:hypothetical protein
MRALRQKQMDTLEPEPEGASEDDEEEDDE